MKVVCVWNIENFKRPYLPIAWIGTYYLHDVCDFDVLWWKNGDEPPPQIAEYDVAIVNLFADMRHVEQIEAIAPHVKVVGLPDSYHDEVMLHNYPHTMNFLRQLECSDVIGVVSDSNRNLYSGLFPDKPILTIPIPIGRDEYFAQARSMKKGDFILTVDHPEITGERHIDYHLQNVATVAGIQRELDCKVIYVNPSKRTREYADFCGLRANFMEYLPYPMFVQCAAQAQLCIDMYALHGFGRNELTCWYAGTPVLASSYTHHLFDGRFAIDPWNVHLGIEAGVALSKRLIDMDHYTTTIQAHYSADAVRTRTAQSLASI